MDERLNEILRAVVENYIDTAEPVGSRRLTKRYDFGLSPATIRNIMADLEYLGFLMQPHTSAGRMPTEKGYRHYVDCYIDDCPQFDEKFILETQARLESIERDVSSLMENVTRELSKRSHQVGIAVAPRFSRSRLSRVELIHVKGVRVLAVVITEEGVVRNLLLDFEESCSQKNLNKISEYINKELAGFSLREARERIISKVYEDKAVYDSLVARAMRIGQVIMERQVEEDIYVEGYSEALEQPDLVGLNSIKEMFRAIEDKRLMIKVFNIIEEMESGVTVLIGSENPLDEMHDCSMVVSPYLKKGRVIGTIGVVGPIRMHYPQVISMVDETAKFLTKVFSETEGVRG